MNTIPATIVLWVDGTKTIVKCQEGDVYSKETGLALCIAKKALGIKGNFNDVFHEWIPEEKPEAVEEGCDRCRFAVATDKLYEVHTPGGAVVKAVFNYCPECGRKMEKCEDRAHE